MKASDLPRGSVDEKTAALARDASRVFAGLDARLVPSVAETFGTLDTMGLAKMTAVADAAKAFEFMRPVVAPQMTEALAEVIPRLAPTYPEAAKLLIGTLPTFDFGPTIQELSAAVIRPHVAESLSEAIRNLVLPKTFSTEIADALRDLARVAPADFAPHVEEAAEEAVGLAEIEVAAEAIDESVGRFEGLSPATRRKIALDVVLLIAAFLTLAAWLSQTPNPKDPEGAGIALVCAATLIRVYWGLTGKLD